MGRDGAAGAAAERPEIDIGVSVVAVDIGVPENIK
jgi:hypothetical protein